MSSPRDYFARLFRQVSRDFVGMFQAARHGHLTGQLVGNFKSALNYTLRWTDLINAGSLRWKARRERLEAAKGMAQAADANEETFRETWKEVYDETVEKTPWAPPHVARINPFVEARVEVVAKIETDWVTARAAAFNGDIAVPVHRIDLARRMAIADVTEVAQQIELADPDIGVHFPFWEYQTRDDRRVRPTHAAMMGFVAGRLWEGWKIIRPPVGFGCRCTLAILPTLECRRRGFLKGDVPQFEVKWPRGLARQNYQQGIFPDEGWKGPKFVA